MAWEYSCGAVLYTMQDGEPFYVLVGDSHFGFPKGHMEPHETEQETALREIYEETGVRATLDTSFCERVEYPLVKKAGAMRRVRFFLATYDPAQSPLPHHEIRAIRIVPYDEAHRLLWHKGLQAILEKAHERLTGQKPSPVNS